MWTGEGLDLEHFKPSPDLIEQTDLIVLVELRRGQTGCHHSTSGRGPPAISLLFRL